MLFMLPPNVVWHEHDAFVLFVRMSVRLSVHPETLLTRYQQLIMGERMLHILGSEGQRSKVKLMVE